MSFYYRKTHLSRQDGSLHDDMSEGKNKIGFWEGLGKDHRKMLFGDVLTIFGKNPHFRRAREARKYTVPLW